MKLTPLHLELLLHYYVSPDAFPRECAPAVIEYTDQMVANNLVCRTSFENRSGKYRLTTKGEYFLEMLLSTPLPVQNLTWADPRIVL